MRVITLNLNGIRAAFRKGFRQWLGVQGADLILLQETRIQPEQLTDEHNEVNGFLSYFSFAEAKGYSGVGVYSTKKPISIVNKVGWLNFDKEGRFLLLEFKYLYVLSLYLPSGTRGEERQCFKYETLDWFRNWISPVLNSGKQILVCGDLNIAHQEIDLKNVKGNRKNSGFLPEERQWMTKLFESGGLCDVFRNLYPDLEMYTWWSNRGRAWEKNVGWRIDYQIATPKLAASAFQGSVYREERFSDHSPLIIDYNWELN
jgi:exodeoxyribonuclease-3